MGTTRHMLPAERVHYEWNSSLSPALVINPDDEVVVDTRISTEDQLLPGASGSDINHLDWTRIHPLTGPIFIRGAKPGDSLEVKVKALRPGSWGLSMVDPRFGLLMNEIQEPSVRFFDLSRSDEQIEFGPGIRIPFSPFLGVMGVARPDGPYSTIDPGFFGGNIDCKEITTGTSLFLPVLVDGALFSTGDAHAVQGDGEICAAIECAMTATLQFIVHKEDPLDGLRVETEDAVMTLGHGSTVELAAQEALRHMLKYLKVKRGLSQEDGYLLCSLAGDPRINEMVNGSPVVTGARYVLPKRVFLSNVE